MKIHLKLDLSSITPPVVSTIKSTNTKLSSIENDVFIYTFDHVVFTHAWELLGQYPSRYGNDLTPYLANTISHFRRVSGSEYLYLGFGDSDFKRKMSEDLGAGIASLFMVDSFGVQWHTIAQIPTNRNLTTKTTRPDFEGFDDSNNRYLYEAKGVSTLAGVLPAIERATTQVKDYPENALHKLVIASYFPTDRRAFPGYTFVLDPQMPDTVPPDRKHAVLLHYIKVFDFIGFTETRRLYTDLLKASFSLELAQNQNASTFRLENRYFNAKGAFDVSFDQSLQNAERINYRGIDYIGRRSRATAERETYSFFFGVQLDIITLGLRKHDNINSFAEGGFADNQHFTEDQTSIFSDGSILRVEQPG